MKFWKNGTTSEDGFLLELGIRDLNRGMLTDMAVRHLTIYGAASKHEIFSKPVVKFSDMNSKYYDVVDLNKEARENKEDWQLKHLQKLIKHRVIVSFDNNGQTLYSVKDIDKVLELCGNKEKFAKVLYGYTVEEDEEPKDLDPTIG